MKLTEFVDFRMLQVKQTCDHFFTRVEIVLWLDPIKFKINYPTNTQLSCLNKQVTHTLHVMHYFSSMMACVFLFYNFNEHVLLLRSHFFLKTSRFLQYFL